MQARLDLFPRIPEIYSLVQNFGFLKLGSARRICEMAALCIVQAAAAAMPAAGYEYRADASGAPAGKSNSSASGSGAQAPLNSAKGFFSPPCITRLPPNFVRQSIIKARRNCSNIGVAQVVAASATDRPPVAAISPPEVVEGLHLGVSSPSALAMAANGAVVAAATNESLLESLRESRSSLPCNEVSGGEKARKSSTLAVHGGEFS